MEPHQPRAEELRRDDRPEQRVREAKVQQVWGDAVQNPEERAHGEDLLHEGEQHGVARVDEVSRVVADALIRVVHAPLRFQFEIRVVPEVLADEQTRQPQPPLQRDEVLDVLVHREERRRDCDDAEVLVDGLVEPLLVLVRQRGHHVSLDVREHDHERGRRRAHEEHPREQRPRADFVVAGVVNLRERRRAPERVHEPRLASRAVLDAL
mmetsp:Transcript_9546/g.34775  ORF Transcript_9546/g.34775 Transcript_9546/m.34775 type:complete len:209 (-) Transcript_9546:262-888(-)|eukprot:31342-Pelagococcus_subviridis.AAC.7